MRPLKIVFAGTPEFAKIIFQAILESSHEVVMVMTQPDRPSGRGLKIHPSPVKELALENQLDVLQPTSLKLDGKYSIEANQALEVLNKTDFDILVVAAYGLILPNWLLDLAQTKSLLGCVNVHASLLPRWRGAAPIHRAIWTGDIQTGTCIMKMAQGLDTGPIIRQESLLIEKLETTKTLHDRLARQGARLLIDVLNDVTTGKSVDYTNQSEQGITYAPKILKEEAIISWASDATQIDRQIRALNPTPGAITHFADTIYKLWLSEDVSEQWQGVGNGKPGEILAVQDDGLYIACGKGVIRVLELQKAGSKSMSAKHCKLSNALTAGLQFN